ncbi:MAG: glutaconate CoA-transferase [Candidatus Freyarchaeota archaeon]|nr:glutaconate CoA-transferase [Candidatus Jordarchaeia archaeon]MBS7279089.1 glutaconate CoA-transferase [Candidatus Jordarchaeia archaeon]
MMSGELIPEKALPTEMLVAATMRELKDKETIFAGIGIPLIAALAAKLAHAPRLTIIVEGGAIDPQPRRLMMGVADDSCLERVVSADSMIRVFSDQQSRLIDVGVISGAQVDKYGNVNSTVIGDYKKPEVRLTGSGGACDIACSAQRLLIMMRQEKRRFPEKVDFITSPGFIDGPGAREKLKLRGKGPAAVITTMGIFRFDEKTKEMYLDSIHPGITVDMVKQNVGWNLKVADELKTTPWPTVDELRIMRALDPLGFFLQLKIGLLDFDTYIAYLDKCYDTFNKYYCERGIIP